MDIRDESIGIIGIGSMGGGIARNLISAGFELHCFDRREEAMEPIREFGGIPARGIGQVLDQCKVVITCVLGRQSLRLYDDDLIPGCRRDQVFIDHATIPISDARRIGAALKEQGAQYLEAPISGGSGGSASGTLRIFVGGNERLVEHCRPLFMVIGNPDKFVYCGAFGKGQAAKVVQQLTERLPDLARIEVLHFGLQSGLDIDLIRKALDIKRDSNGPYAALCRALESGRISELSFEFSEWEFYLEQAKTEGFRMPTLEAYYAFVKNGEIKTVDGAGRSEPSVWDELDKG